MEGEEILYQVEANNRRPKDVAREFAERYWDWKRTVENFRECAPGSWLFNVEDGTRTYLLRYVPVEQFRPATFQVKVWKGC